MRIGRAETNAEGVLSVKWTPLNERADSEWSNLRCTAQRGDTIREHKGRQWSQENDRRLAKQRGDI